MTVLLGRPCRLKGLICELTSVSEVSGQEAGEDLFSLAWFSDWNFFPVQLTVKL
ncbi:hypothetical protein Cva_00719 [Caedimonas varicaedens]|uniref:Uncharacterized protein n=1 Tax=Caedimonas varicaedens TaxID=1629334 RepID=A0A0K8MC38_9PROT|nr:hypothetical protein Cva_00719 [Caedimonas varicaedens]